MKINKQKWEALLAGLLTPRTLAVFMTILYVGSLIPLFVIAKYNFPSADDYSIGETCRHAWTDTHSVFAVIWQAVVMAWEDFFHWMGYFSSIFLMSIHPAVFGEGWYAATTYIMVGMVSFGTWYLLHAVFVKAMKLNRSIIHSIAMMSLFVTIQCLIGRNEALYWFCGAVNYTFMHGLSLFFYGALVSLFFDQGKKRKWDMAVACFSGFVVGAGNYMTSLNVCIILAAASLVILAAGGKQKGMLLKRMAVPSLFFLAAFLLSCFAPGNSYRAAGTTAMNPVKAVLVSFYYALDYCLGEWSSWVTVILVIFAALLFWSVAGNTDFSFPCPLIVVIFSYCVLSAMITPPLYAVSNITAGRLQALIYMMYILLLTLDVCYVTGWMRKKFSDRVLQGLSLNSIYGIIACIGFLFFGSLLCVVPEPRYYTFTSALTDLADGSAGAYGQAQRARAELLNSDAAGEIVLEKLPAEPELLFFADITTSSDSWENQAVARYYRKEAVVRKE